MSRFSQLFTSLPLPIRPRQIKVGLDLGSSTTRLRVGSSLRLSQPSSVVVHSGSNDVIAVGKKAEQFQPGNHRQTFFKTPVKKGIPTDIELVQDYLRSILNQAIEDKELTLLTQISGVCLVPSVFSQVEQQIFDNLFAQLGQGSWRLQRKATVWQRVLTENLHQAVHSNQQVRGCIDLGGDTTEVILIDGEQTVWAETIKMGGRQLVKRIIETIRIDQGLQISWQTAEKILQEFDLSALLSEKSSEKKVTVRGKYIATGKPETVVINLSILHPTLKQFYDELFAFVALFFARVPTQLLTESLEHGLLLSGGLSQVAATDVFFAQTLDTVCVVSESPVNDLIKHIW